MVELAVLASDQKLADKQLDIALAVANEAWMPETTARNLKLIREFRTARGEDVSWLNEMIAALEDKSRA